MKKSCNRKLIKVHKQDNICTKKIYIPYVSSIKSSNHIQGNPITITF